MTTIRSAQILDGTLVNADIAAGAAIDWSKISKVGATLGDVGGGAGTAGTLAKWTAAAVLGNSIVTETTGAINVAGFANLNQAAGEWRSGAFITVADGTPNYATIRLTAGTVVGQLTGYPQSYVTTGGGYDVPASMSFLCHGSNGVSMVCTAAGAPIKFFMNGPTAIVTLIPSGSTFNCPITVNDVLTMNSAAVNPLILNSTHASGGYLALRHSGAAFGFLGSSFLLTGWFGTDDVDLYTANRMAIYAAAGLTISGGGGGGGGITMRSGGYTGRTAQNPTNALNVYAGTPPAGSGSGFATLYVRDNGSGVYKFYYMDSAGTEYAL